MAGFFFDYAATLIFQDIGSQNLGPVTDESDLLLLLGTESFSWNKGFQSLAQETQQSIARQVLQLKEDAGTQPTDSPESGNHDDSFRPVLEGHINEMEDKQFLLELEEMLAYYLKADDSSRLAEMVGLAQDIQGSSFLAMDRWQAVQTMTQKDGFMNMELGRIEMLGQSWFQSILDCGDQPYQHADPTRQVVLEGGEADNPKEENSTHELDEILVLLDTSLYEESLSPLMNLHQIVDSSKTELEDRKLVLEEELRQAEEGRKKSVASLHQQNLELEKRLESYNLEVQSENLLHQNLLDARLRQRIAQEKYQWAGRIYLGSLGSSESSTPNAYKSPLSRYNDTLLAVSRHQQALDILRQIKGRNGSLGDKEYERQLLDYQQALEDSYVMQVVLSQALTAVAKQEQATQEAELKDRINVSKLLFSRNQLTEASGTEKAVPLLSESPALELVRITRDDAGNYILGLGHSTDYVKTGTIPSIDSNGNSTGIDIYGYVTSLRPSAGTLDEALLEEYLTAKSETVIQVKETLRLTRAEVEARQWLKDMYSKGDDYLNRLLLASLHLKTYSDRSKDFLGGQADLREDGQFQADQIPEVRSFHSMDVKSRYAQERAAAAASAYSSIMRQEGGEEDLARYILYRETSLLDKQEWMRREKALVERLALEEVREELADKQSAKTVEAAVSFALAASLSIAAIFCKPLWAAVATATVTAVAATDAAISLKEAKDSVGDLENGKQSVVSAETQRLGGLMDCLLDGEANLEEQWELLNFFYYGGQSAEETGSLIHERVIAALDKMLAGSPLVSDREYGELVSRERVDAMLSGDSQKVTDILDLVAGELAGGLSLAELSLGQETARLREQSQAAMGGFHQMLGRSAVLSPEDRQRLAELEAMSTDGSLSTAQRQAAVAEYEELYRALHARNQDEEDGLTALAQAAYGDGGWDSLGHRNLLYSSGKSLYNTRVDLSTETEDYTVWLQSHLARQAASGWQEGASQVMEQSYHRWQLEGDLLARRRQQWEGEVTETLAAGRSGWQRMEEKLNKEYTLWRRRFQKELEERQARWEGNYLEYLNKKEAWVQDSHVRALEQGLASNPELPSPVGTKELDAAALSRSMESGVSHQTAAATVEALLGDFDLQQLIDRSATLAGLGRSAATGIRRERRGVSSLGSLLEARRQAERNGRLMTRVAERKAVDSGQERLEQILEGYMEGIDSRNQAMVDWQERLAWDAGYSVDGDIRRTIVVDATLMNPVRETQYLPVYRHFRVSAPQLRSPDTGTRNNAMQALHAAQQELESWGEGIFGDNGELEKHLGTAPRTVNTPDPSGSKQAAFSDLGSGQRGAILVEYYWNSIKARKGMEELGKAGHDKRLFDDRGLPFTAPTLREVGEVAMNIIGTATGQAWWFSHIDDAVFAGVDLGGGYKTAGEIGREVAVKAAGAAIGAGTSWAGNAMSGITNIAGKAAATAGLNLASGALSTLSTTTLQGMDFSKIGTGDFFNSDIFMSQMGNKSTWASLVAGAASSGVSTLSSGLLDKVNMRNVNGFNSQQIRNMGAMNGLAGSLAGVAAEYAIAGQTTVNLLNLADIGEALGVEGLQAKDENGNPAGVYHRMGLLELRLGGDDGGKLGLGTGGADMGIGAVTSALDGLGSHIMNGRIQGYVSKSGLNVGDSLRSQWGFGDGAATEQLSSILSGDTVLAVGGTDGVAETRLDGQGRRAVSLSGYREGMSTEEQLALGLVLQHEAHRDGVADETSQQGSETLAATTAHTQMTLGMLADSRYTESISTLVSGSRNLQSDLTAYAASRYYGDDSIFAGYVAGNYDSSGDYWKLNLEGEIEWDGSRDLNVEYRDEHGNVKIKHGHIKDDTGSFSQSLAKYVGMSRAQEILKLNLNDASSYDLQTLVDVLKIHPMMANTLQRVDELPSIVTDTQREKLVGETLMKKHGMTWDIEKNAWIWGMEPIKLTDNSAIGQIVINKDTDGTYNRFGIFGVVERNVLSYDSTRKQSGGSPDYQGLDVLKLYKTDLDGNIIDSNISFGWQTVANGYSDVRHEIKTTIATEVYRDETVVAGETFNLRFGDFKNHQTFGGNYFIINSGTTIAGMKIDSAGNTSEVWDRILGHSNFLNEKGRADNGGLISAACFINAMDTINSINDWVMKDIAYPYEIKSIVNEIDWSRRR